MDLGERSNFYIDPENTKNLDPNGPLIAFENYFPSFVSFRKIVTMQQSFDMLNGLSPENSIRLKSEIVMASLFNSEKEIKIGDTIYWQFNNIMFLINDITDINKIKIGRTINPETARRLNKF